MFFDPRKYDFRPRLPPEVQHQMGWTRPWITARWIAPDFVFGHQSISSSCQEHGVVDDIDFSATAAFARLRSCSKTSSVSASSALERAIKEKMT